MSLKRIDNLTWEFYFNNSEKSLIKIRETQDQDKFKEFLKNMPIESAYPKDIVLSESDLRPGEFRLTKNHFIVEIENKIIGALSFHPGNEHDYHFRHGVRVHINILPFYSRKGFGNTLLEVFEEYAVKEKYYRISTGTIASNIAAINLFLKKGFKIEGKTKRAIKLRFKNQEGEKIGQTEIFVDAILLGKWIGPEIIDFPYQY